MRTSATRSRVTGGTGQLSLLSRAMAIIKRNGGSMWWVPDNALGDGAPNLLSAPEFAAGLADAPTRSGLLTLASMSGYDNAIAFGRDGVTASYAYKQTTLTAGAVYALSVIVQMDDGLAPSFSDAGGSTSVNNSFALVIRGNATAPSTNVVTSLGGGLFRVSCYDGTSGAGMQNIGVVKYPSNDTRTFKVTGYKLELGSTATAYTPQSVLRTRGTFTDSAGTTAASVNQPIGLMLDAMGVVGPELATQSSWVAPGIGGPAFTVQNVTPAKPIGKTYALSATVSGYSGSGTVGFSGLEFGGSAASSISGNGSIYAVLQSTATDPTALYIRSTNTATFSNISVREITGNHATQPTTASKPTLTRVPKRTLGPENRFLWSSDLTNALWYKSGVTATAGQADSSGGLTASRIVAPGGAYQYVYQVVSWASGAASTLAIKVKSATGANQLFRLACGSSGVTYSPVLTATNQWRVFVLNFFSSSPDVCAVVSDVNGSTASPFDIVVERFGAFTGTYTAQQILDNGGIPLTTTQALPNVLGWTNAMSFDGSNDFLSAPTTAIGPGETLIFGGCVTGGAGTNRCALARRDDAVKSGMMIYADASDTYQVSVGNRVGFVAVGFNTPATSGAPVVLTAVGVAGSTRTVTTYANGVLKQIGVTLDPVAPVTAPMYVGGLTTMFPGAFSAVAVVRCTVALNDADRKIIEKWIGSLQGQSL